MRYLAALLLPCLLSRFEAAGTREIEPIRTWFGVLREAEKSKLAPPQRFLSDAAAFARLWRAWKPDDQVPPVDFRTHLVIVVADDKMRIDRFRFRLSEEGDLSITLGAAASKSDPFFPSFGMALIPRAGIRTIAGRGARHGL